MLNTQSELGSNRYHKEFLWVAILIIGSVLAFMTLMGGIRNGFGFFFFQQMISEGLIIIACPFIVPFFMSIRWGLSKRNFTKRDFFCRIAGLMTIFIIYFFVLHKILALFLTTPGALIGLVLYPLSVPFVMPVLYWIGYGIGNLIFANNDKQT